MISSRQNKYNEDQGIKSLTAATVYYSLIIALAIELLSLPVLGWDPQFIYGLALGTCVSIVNYRFLIFTSKKIVDGGKNAWLAVVGYIVRLCIYGGVFYLSYKTGPESGVGTLLGYLTLKLSIYYTYGFRPGFRSKSYKGKELNDLDQDQWARHQEEKRLKKKNRDPEASKESEKYIH